MISDMAVLIVVFTCCCEVKEEEEEEELLEAVTLSLEFVLDAVLMEEEELVVVSLFSVHTSGTGGLKRSRVFLY